MALPGRGWATRAGRFRFNFRMNWNFILITLLKIVCVIVPVLTMVARVAVGSEPPLLVP